MYQFLVREKWSKFQTRKNDNFQVWKTLRNALAMMLREKSCVDMTMMTISMLMAIILRVPMWVDDQCALTCWMELVTVSRESKEFATRSIFSENIYY